jgi:hypothetical protein
MSRIIDSAYRSDRNVIGAPTMTALSTAPLPLLIARLPADAEATSNEAIPAFMQLPAAGRQALMASTTGYREFYGRLKHAHLAVSRETGTLLDMLARSIGARAIIESGTSFGNSTLLARVRAPGGGFLSLPFAGDVEPSMPIC